METLMEERESNMVSPSGGRKPCFRVAHFLKPSFPISQQQKFPPISSPTKPISQIAKSLSSKINFNGWKTPLKNWSNWVDKLLPKFQSTWKNTSIYEPIMGSKYEIPRFRGSIFSISEKWCPENNTFVFNWGEVTITLEDIWVLGGYSVTGDSVLSKISSTELQEVKHNLSIVYSELNNSKAKKVSHYQWMDIWMNNGSEFEHEAFLTLWLSRYVIPTKADGVINKGVFSLAILLARGTKIALAPAILSGIYKDLRLLKDKIMWLRELGDEIDDGSVSKFSLSSPLYLLQVWIWERFPILSPKSNLVTDGLPRLQKWHKVAIPKNDGVGFDFDGSMESFRWRPYATGLSNCSSCARLYVEEGGWVLVDSEACSIDLESYVRIVRNSKLVGLNCVEQYLPHRVSMQFGIDQDIPCEFPRVRDTRNLGWNDYNRPVGGGVKVYVSSRLFEPGVTTRYLEWWKGAEDVKDNVKCVRKRNDAETDTKPCQVSSTVSLSVPPGFSPKREVVEVDDCIDQHQPSSKRSRVTPYRVEIVIDSSSESEASPGLSSRVERVKSDEEPDDDCLTLAELFKVKSVQNTKPCQVSSKVSLSVPPGFSPKREVVEVDDCIDQHQPSSKTSRVTPCRVEIVIDSSSESEASPGLSSRVERVKSDEEPDDDCLTLAELFKVKSVQKEVRSEALSVNRRESPQSSAADNALIEEITSTKENIENTLPNEEYTRKESITEDKSESKAGSQVTTPTSTEVNITRTTFNGAHDSPESPKIDLLDGIARLERIYNIYKSATRGSLESRVKPE